MNTWIAAREEYFSFSYNVRDQTFPQRGLLARSPFAPVLVCAFGDKKNAVEYFTRMLRSMLKGISDNFMISWCSCTDYARCKNFLSMSVPIVEIVQLTITAVRFSLTLSDL